MKKEEDLSTRRKERQGRQANHHFFSTTGAQDLRLDLDIDLYLISIYFAFAKDQAACSIFESRAAIVEVKTCCAGGGARRWMCGN
jgi:hypothetical protein